MVALIGPLAMIDGELRQAWKGATVTIDSCAGVWLVWVATLMLSLSFVFLRLHRLYTPPCHCSVMLLLGILE